MNDDAAKFWNDFEAETGEKVEARTIGTYYEPEGDDRGLWGLLVLTDSSFRFKHLPSDNWIVSLLKSNRTAKPAERAMEIVVPRASIVSVEEPVRGFLGKLFGSAFPRFTLSWKEGGGERRAVFAADPASDFLRRLRELPRREAAPKPGEGN
jgi:hypothetical protein